MAPVELRKVTAAAPAPSPRRSRPIAAGGVGAEAVEDLQPRGVLEVVAVRVRRQRHRREGAAPAPRPRPRRRA